LIIADDHHDVGRCIGGNQLFFKTRDDQGQQKDNQEQNSIECHEGLPTEKEIASLKNCAARLYHRRCDVACSPILGADPARSQYPRHD
jgi:hypothetical protein